MLHKAKLLAYQKLMHELIYNRYDSIQNVKMNGISSL